VLSGEASPTGDALVGRDAALSSGVSVQEVQGALSAEQLTATFFLEPFEPGDTLYVFVEPAPPTL
jgi:hypothetical protein